MSRSSDGACPTQQEARRRGATSGLPGRGWLTRLLRRPEAGAAGGLLATMLDLRAPARRGALYSLQGSMTFLTLSAELGIIATAAALLIIAGEFDLSVGSMIGFAGVVDRADGHAPRLSALGRHRSRPSPVAIVVGYLNGLIVVKTRLPSFIVTLASLFILRGLSIAHDARRHRPHADPLHPRRRPRPADGADSSTAMCSPGSSTGWASMGWIATRSDGMPFVGRHPDVDRLVDRASPRSPARC